MTTSFNPTSGEIVVTPTASAVACTRHVNGTTQEMEANTRYVLDNVAQTTLVLPATIPDGAVIEIVSGNAGGDSGFVVLQRSGQRITFGIAQDGKKVQTTVGTGGSLSSAERSAVTIVCIVSDKEFVVTSELGSLSFN